MASPARTPQEQLDDNPERRLFLMSEEEKEQVWQQCERNRKYLFSRWEELIRDHRGRWAAAYGDCQLIIGDSYEELDDQLYPDWTLGSFIWELGTPPGVVRIPG